MRTPSEHEIPERFAPKKIERFGFLREKKRSQKDEKKQIGHLYEKKVDNKRKFIYFYCRALREHVS